jgi:HSP20 family protein
MFVGQKLHIHPRSFHHRIRDGQAHYFDQNHFLGVDPLDHSKFHDIYAPPVNVKNLKESYDFEVVIPGFKKSEIEVNVDNDKIVVSGKKEEDNHQENIDYVHYEHEVDAFRREFFMGPDADMERIEALFKDGILYIKLHKKEGAQKSPGKKKIVVA